MIYLRNKNIWLFGGVFLLLGILMGCSLTYIKSIKCPSYVVCYTNLDSINLSIESTNPLCLLINHGNDLPAMSYGLRSTGADKERYEQLCQKHNDLSYNQYRLLICDPIDDLLSVTYNECDFTEIKVTADKDFDATHPAGANMADIVRFMSWSPYLYILSGYSEYYHYDKSDVSDAFNNLMRIYIGNKYFDSNLDATCYPVDKLIQDLTAEDLTLNGYDAPGFIGMLYFEKGPSEQGEYNITVSLKTDDGRVLSDTARIKF